MLRNIFLLTLALFAFSCDDDDAGNNDNFNTTFVGEGADFFVSTNTPSDVYADIIATLDANDAIGIVAQVNHQQNAANNNLELAYTRTVLFGNPALGTPIMQENQLAGLDLPQRISVFQSGDETVIAYNSVEYFRNRHGVNTTTLDQIETALTNIAGSGDPEAMMFASTNSTGRDQGIEQVQSNQDFDATYTALFNAIDGNENLTVVAELNHQANGASVGLDLRPTKLIIFGNPNLGTPLMQSKQGVSVDLPQKMLVYEMEDGTVMIAYNDPENLSERFGLSDDVDSNLETIAGALDMLATTAAGQ